MPKFQVPLVAKGIEVTASTLAEAESYALADSREFLDSWVWQSAGDPFSVGPEQECTSGEVASLLISGYSVNCTEQASPGSEGIYTFDLVVTPVVDAADEAVARQIALALYSGGGFVAKIKADIAKAVAFATDDGKCTMDRNWEREAVQSFVEREIAPRLAGKQCGNRAVTKIAVAKSTTFAELSAAIEKLYEAETPAPARSSAPRG